MQRRSVQEMTTHYDPSIKKILPHSKMYTIQIGNERFILSGASLSSDAPSYFTNYFSQSANSDQVLFIDRSPRIFQYIYSHLQGYHVEIDDADTFTGLFSDALYYHLPQLRQLILNSDYYYANIGGESIKVSKKLLSGRGNTPNFFTVANDSLYKDISDIITDMNWIRPPPQAAPSLNRSPILFKELVHMLQGAEPEIRSPEHRRSLIKEAKYYRFNALAEKLQNIIEVYNPFTGAQEIAVSLDSINPECLVLQPGHYVCYKRKYTEESPKVLLIRITKPEVSWVGDTALVFHNETANKIQSLFPGLLSPDNQYQYQSNQLAFTADLKNGITQDQCICITECLIRLQVQGRGLELIVNKACGTEAEWGSLLFT